MTSAPLFAALVAAILQAAPAPAPGPAAPASAAPPAASAGSAQDAIRATFEAYRQALKTADGKAAAEQVGKATFDTYERLRKVALQGSGEKVRALPYIDQFMVLRLRHDLGAAKLAKLDGRQLFELGVANGWISQGSVERVSLGDIEIKGTEAKAVALANGKPTPLRFEFREEDGRWRLDLNAMMAVGETAFRTLAKQAEGGPDAFLLDLLEKVSQRKPAADIWDKPGK